MSQVNTANINTYNRTINKEYWNSQLSKIGRKLTKNDIALLEAVKEEKERNTTTKNFHDMVGNHGLYIAHLTNLVGDCMFESLEHAGLADHIMLRRYLSILFILYGDYEDLIPGYNMKLKDVFTLTNEKKYVVDKTNNKLYRYTYYTMCADMYNQGSWTRLPTQLILTIISIFFKVTIYVYHDNGHVTIIDRRNDTQAPEHESNIYLGLICNHYVPLAKYDSDKIPPCPKYTYDLKRFHKWAQRKFDMINKK